MAGTSGSAAATGDPLRDDVEADDGGRPQGRRFWSASFFVVAAVVGVANVAHIFADRYEALRSGPDPSGANVWIGAALALVGVAFVVAAWLALTRWRRTVQLFASLEFAALATFVVLLGTAVGTVILQKQPVERLVEYYGESLYGIFQGLHFFDLFHSFWFMAVLGLVGVSLSVDAALRVRDIVAKKPNAWRKAGFVLTHGGIVVVLIGGLVSHLGGDKGMIDLTKGMVAERFVRYEAKEGEERIGPLGFGLRLDDFELEYYDPAWSVYLFREKGVGKDGRAEFETVAALDPTKKERRSFGDGYELAVAALDLPQQVQAGATSHELVVRLPGGGEKRIPVKVGDTVPLGDGTTLAVDRYLPHFNFDIKTKRAVSVSDRPENPTLEVTVRRPGAEPQRTWLFAKNPGFSMGGHGGAESGEDITQRVAYRLSQPEVVLTLSQRGKLLSGPDGARLPLGASTALFPPDSPAGTWAVAFHEKGDRIKQYHSTVSIIDGGKVVIDRAPLSVNSPVSYGGFSLYQSNFRAWDLNYSGIQVVRDPGLPVVYAGMILMMLGVVYVLYFRRRPARAAASEAAQGDDPAPAGDAASSERSERAAAAAIRGN